MGIAKEQKADAVLIAGDVYDRAQPSEDAVSVFNAFMTKLANIVPIYVIAGNHDSAERLGFGRGLMRDTVHIAGPYQGYAERFTAEDSHGKLNIYLLPYIKTSTVCHYYDDDESIKTPEDAFQKTIDKSGVDPDARNVLICHQFITSNQAPKQTDSEDARYNVGGTDNISYELLAPFDYVALGHIHSPQKVKRETVRYCGSPLKYSASEAGDIKSVTVVDVGEKGDVKVSAVPLKPLHDLVSIVGTRDELIEKARGLEDCYVYAIIRGRSTGVADALREMCPLFLAASHELSAGSTESISERASDIAHIPPWDMFTEFYKQSVGREPSKAQRKIFSDAFDKAEKEVSE